MKRSSAKNRSSLLLTSVLCLLCLVFPAEKGVAFESSGMSLSVFSDKTTFALGETVKLSIVLKNISGVTVITDSGVSASELHRFLSITDPAGVTHGFGAGSWVHDMPQPIFWKDKSWRGVEGLPGDYLMSQEVSDLGILLPMVRTDPGWYTIRCSLPFARYEPAQTEVNSHYGTLGPLESESNWTGTVDSAEIQILISSDKGGRFEVQTVDKDLNPLPQIPVRIYRSDEIAGKELKGVWNDVPPVLSGITDFKDGVARTWYGPGCIPEGGYTALAYYQGDYKRAEWTGDPSEGWAAGCGGLLTGQIIFGDEGPVFPPLSSFSAYALNSIWIKAGAAVNSGNIGVHDSSQGLWLDSGVEVSIGLNARAADGVAIYGDSVKLWPGASVDQVHYNELSNSGTIRGAAVTPLELPPAIELPAFPESIPGSQNISVGLKKIKTINPGAYRDVSLGISSTLNLKEGTYHFRNLNMGASSKLICLGPGATEIRIKERLYPGLKSTMTPASSSESAKKLMIYINGTNGNILNLLSYPRAAEVGLSSTVRANIYAPNGTLTVGAGSSVKGALIGKGIELGINSKLTLDSGF